MSKELAEEIINDIVHKHNGDRNATVVLFHSNGKILTTSYQYLIFEDTYIKVLKANSDDVNILCSVEYCAYVPYATISAIYTDCV